MLQDNRRQLQTNLQRATHRLPPLASIGGRGAALTAAGKQTVLAAAVGLPGAPSSQPPAAGKAKQFQSHGLWTFLWGGGSASSPAASPASPAATVAAAADDKRRDSTVVVVEYTKGKRRVYRLRAAAAAAEAGEAADGEATPPSGATLAGFDILDDAVRGRQRVTDVLADYLLPQGYPASVAPQYKDYMSWRGVQYFFGGACACFSLLSLERVLCWLQVDAPAWQGTVYFTSVYCCVPLPPSLLSGFSCRRRYHCWRLSLSLQMPSLSASLPLPLILLVHASAPVPSCHRRRHECVHYSQPAVVSGCGQQAQQRGSCRNQLGGQGWGGAARPLPLRTLVGTVAGCWWLAAWRC